MRSPLAARLWPEPGTRMWQATARNSSSGGASNAGGTASHTSSANGQRVRKRQPGGRIDRIGRIAAQRRLVVRRRGSIDGIAESSARV